MADYKEMYLRLFRASEEAMNIIIKAQRECEEMYMNGVESQASPTENSQESDCLLYTSDAADE